MFRRPLLAAVLVLFLGEAAPAEDSPRDLLVRAVAAQGGEARLTRGAGLYRKLKGRYFSSSSTLVGESFHQYPGYYKDVVRLLEQAEATPFFYIITPDKGYVGPKESIQESSGEAHSHLLLGSYKDHLRDLLIGLLHDKSARFTALTEATVHERPARGLHYESERFGSMDLYFDKANDFLVKMAYEDRSPTLGGRKPDNIRKVVILIDAYREPDYKGWCERALKTAGHKSDPELLLQLLRRQTLDAAGRKRLEKLIENLGDESFEVREKATTELMATGLPALPYLQRASKDSDPEVKRRARHCLVEIDKPGKRETLRDALVAALQLLDQHPPAGTTEALLAYLPLAKDDLVKWEVLNTLETVARRGDKPDPAVLAALESKDALVRQTAAGLLGRDNGVFSRRLGRRIDVTGVKLPTKFLWLVNEEKNTEWEITEYRFYNGFEKSVFDKP